MTNKPESVPHVNVEAVIFDLDGTLVDNMDLHASAFSQFTSRHGLPDLTASMRRRIDGKRNRDIFPILFDSALSPEIVRAHTQEKEELYREYSRGKLSPINGLVSFLDYLKIHDLPFAIATSAPLENVQHSLKEIGLASAFDIIVRGDEVPRGKPFPDVFLAAADKLSVEPEACLVYEDAPVGVEAALAAGMLCTALTTSFTESTFQESVHPHHFIQDYNQVLENPKAYGLA